MVLYKFFGSKFFLICFFILIFTSFEKNQNRERIKKNQNKKISPEKTALLSVKLLGRSLWSWICKINHLSSVSSPIALSSLSALLIKVSNCK